MMTYDDYQSKLFLGIFPPLRLWHKVPYRRIPGTIYASIIAKLSLALHSFMDAVIDKLDSRDLVGDHASFHYYICGDYEEDQIIKAQQKDNSQSRALSHDKQKDQIIKAQQKDNSDVFESCHENIT